MENNQQASILADLDALNNNNGIPVMPFDIPMVDEPEEVTEEPAYQEEVQTEPVVDATEEVVEVPQEVTIEEPVYQEEVQTEPVNPVNDSYVEPQIYDTPVDNQEEYVEETVAPNLLAQNYDSAPVQSYSQPIIYTNVNKPHQKPATKEENQNYLKPNVIKNEKKYN